MKKTLKLLCGIICLLSVVLITLSGCDMGNLFDGSVNVPKGDGFTPVYYGMLMSTSPDVEIPPVSYEDVVKENAGNNGNHNGWYKKPDKDKENNGNTDNNGNHYGWYKDDNGDGKLDEDFQQQLCYLSQNQDVYFYVGIGNPAQLEIVSIQINGKTYTSDMFEANSTNEVKILKHNVGNAGGIVEYTIEEIKYSDGTEVKDVVLAGNKTARAGIKVENAVTATVNNIELRDSGKEIFFDITIADDYSLIANSNGVITVTVYRDGKSVKSTELIVGKNEVTIETLNKNKEHEYEIVAYYDDLSGEGATYHTLISRRPVQEIHTHTFDVWTVTKEASCTEDGEKMRTCTACGEIKTEKISATGHKWSNDCDTMCNVEGCGFTRETEHQFNNACDADCNVCGEIRVVLGHVYDNACDADCNVCGATRVVLGHAYDNACDADCNVCGATRVVLGHVYDNECDADCNVCGEIRVVLGHVYDNECDADCNVCGATRVVLGHVYDNACDADCNVCGATRVVLGHIYDNACDADCNECGFTRVTDHTYDDQYDAVCNVCGFVRDAECAHKNVVALPGKEANCIETGLTEGQKCEDCGELIVEQTIIPATGIHNYESTVTPPTATENGVITYTCSTCGHTYSETIVPTNFTITADNRAMVGYTGEANENLVIPAVFEDNGTWYRVVEIAEFAFYYSIGLTNITIPETMRTIGAFSFVECDDLISVTMLGATTIGYNAFNSCDQLRTVTLPNSLTTIEGFAFFACVSLENITIPNSVTVIGECAFRACYKLTSMHIPASVTTIGYGVFGECTGLIAITVDADNPVYYSEGNCIIERDSKALIQGCKTSVIPQDTTSISREAFYWIGLTNVTIPNTVTTIGEAAFSWTGLSSITFTGTIAQWMNIEKGSRWDDGTGNYTVYCTDGTIAKDGTITYYEVASKGLEFTLNPDEASYSVTGIGTCTDTDIVIPSTHKGLPVTGIGEDAFYSQRDITSLKIPNSIVEIGNEAFHNCSSLKNVYINDLEAWCNISFSNGCANPLERGANLWVDNEMVTTLVIPTSITEIKEFSFEGCGSIKNIVFHNNVTKIGREAFFNCGNIETLTIPDSVTAIDDWAFYWCSGLESVTIGTGVKNIGWEAFYECYSLKTVVFADGATVIGDRMFGGCSALTDVIIPNSMAFIVANAFHRCSSLENIYYKGTMEEWGKIVIDDTNLYGDDNILDFPIYYYSATKPTTEGNFWHYVNGVPTVWEVEIHTHSYTGEGIPSADYATVFVTYTCSTCGHTYSETITPTDFTVTAENRTMVGYTGAENENLVIPAVFEDNGIWYRVICIGDGVFNNSSNLANVVIPNSVTAISVWAFRNCTNLTSVMIPNSVTIIGEAAFSGCTNLTSVTIGNSVITIDDYAFFGCFNLTEITIPHSVTTIGQSAFYNCSNLTRVTIGDSVTSIGANAFHSCTNLTSITIGDSLTTIGDLVFYSCFNLTNIAVDENNVTYQSINGNLYSKDGTILVAYAVGKVDTSFIIPNSVTTIGDYAFYGCSSLMSITIPDSVTSIGMAAFSNCSSLTGVTIPHSVAIIGDGAFLSCTNLTSVTIGNSVTTIGANAFFGCSNLTDVTIPNSVTTIGDYAFSHCSSLTSVTMGSSVTIIGDWAFYWCTNLTSVTIGDFVTFIGVGVFSNCTNLTYVYYAGIESGWTNISIGGYNNNLLNATHYYYSETQPTTEGNFWHYVDGVPTVWEVEIHTHSYECTVTPPTATENGVATYTCLCGDTYSDIIVPTDFTVTAENRIMVGFTGEANENLVIPAVFVNDGTWYRVTKINPFAFGNCKSLKKVNIPASISHIEVEVFHDCFALNWIEVDSNNKTYCSIDGNLYTKDGKELVRYALGKTETEFIVPDGVESIGHYSFYFAPNLTRVILNNEVTCINTWAFQGCGALESIVLTASVKEIVLQAFQYCDSLTAVYYTGTEIEWGNILFGEANENLINATRYYYSETQPTTEGNYWHYVDGVPTVWEAYVKPNYSVGLEYTPNGDGTCYVSGIGTCTDTDIIIPEISPDGDTVISIGTSAFEHRTNLTSVVIPNSVINIEKYAFQFCMNLKSLTIGSSVDSIEEYAFYNCFNITSVVIPDSVISIGDYAFMCTNSLEELVIGDSVISIGEDAFLYCYALMSITVGENNSAYCAINNCLIERESKTLLLGANNSVIPTDGCVTSIKDRAFIGCSQLSSIVIPNSIVSIGNSTFYDCNSLTCVYYSGNESEWKNILFGPCNDNLLNATRYYYSETQPTTEGNFWHYVDGVPTVWEVEIHTHSYECTVTPPTATENGVATYTCLCGDTYSDIIVPTDFTVTAENRIMVGFTGEANENLVIPAVFVNDGTWYRVTKINPFAFGNCKSLKKVNIPASISHIEVEAFHDCFALNWIEVDSNNKTYCSIDGNLYTKDGKELVRYALGKTETEFIVPDGVESIGNYSFYFAPNLTRVILNNEVTCINTWAFQGCGALESIVLTASVKEIELQAFQYCDSLTVVYYTGTAEEWNSIIIDNEYDNNIALLNATRYYYSEAQPTTEGNFWHYVDGVPAVWEAYVAPNYSLGLEYTSNGDGTCYVSGIGTCKDADIIIPSTYDGLSVTAIGQNWNYVFSNNQNIRSVVIPDTVTYIDLFAFSGCVNLESVTLGSNTFVDEMAFLGCSSLKTIHLPAMAGVGGRAFDDCTALESITVDNAHPYYKSIDGNLYNKQGTLLIQYALGKSDTSFILPDGVTEIGHYALSEAKNLKHIVLSYGLTTIGTAAFSNCNSLESIIIPASVTSIGIFNQEFAASGPVFAFAGCNNLNAIYYEGSVADWSQISIELEWDGTNPFDNIFRYYYSENQPTTEGNYWHYVDGVPTVWEIHIHNYTSVVTTEPTATANGVITYTCSCGDSYTEELVPQDFSVTKDNRAMVGYTGEANENLVIPAVFKDNDVWYRVTSIGMSAFYTCSNLTGITIPDSVTAIDNWAFHSCTNLTSVTIPDSVTSMGEYAFLGCTNLASVTIINSVTNIGRGAFADCDNLTSITIPDSVTTIGDSAFIRCDNLTSVTIGNSVTSIGGYAFYDCDGLTSVIIGDSVTTIGGYAFYDCDGLTSITLPDAVTTIGNSAFYDCDNLTSITLPDAVTTIGNSAFYDCDNLTSVTIGDSVTTIGNAVFYGCSNLTSITIPDSVTIIGDQAFFQCTNLMSITIPDSVTTISDSAFFNCTNLTSVTIGNSVTTIGYGAFCSTNLTSITIPNSVTTIGNAVFYGCSNLTSITIPDSVTIIGDQAFFQCTNLMSITIPNSVTTIGDYAFESCNLTSITIPDSVTTIGKCTFSSCYNLTSVTIGDSVTTIDDSAFFCCYNLTSITIPDSVTSIRECAFMYCSRLKIITFEGTVEQWNAIEKEDGSWNNSIPTTEVICSDGVVSLV